MLGKPGWRSSVANQQASCWAGSWMEEDHVGPRGLLDSGQVKPEVPLSPKPVLSKLSPANPLPENHPGSACSERRPFPHAASPPNQNMQDGAGESAF